VSRSDLKIEEGGFPIYPGRGTGSSKAIAKWNAQRRVESAADMKDPPILTRSQVMFSTAESAHDEPRSCFNCPMQFEKHGRCKYFGPRTKIYKFTQGEQDGNPIEYWPVCGYWIYGEPSQDAPAYFQNLLDPEDAGLCWVNAPKPGLKHSGTCCGGGNDGDDCDYWRTEGEVAKWDATVATCRVLQSQTANMDCCACWDDDDLISWQIAAQFLKDRP
jgi:hypothetical protein